MLTRAQQPRYTMPTLLPSRLNTQTVLLHSFIWLSRLCMYTPCLWLKGTPSTVRVPCLTPPPSCSRRWYQAVASTSLLHHDESIWRCAAAPEPAEVLWAGLGMRLWERQTRTVLLRAAYSVLLLTYAIPVSALQAGLQVWRLGAYSCLAIS